VWRQSPALALADAAATVRSARLSAPWLPVRLIELSRRFVTDRLAASVHNLTPIRSV
jgi:hypothetical protein